MSGTLNTRQFDRGCRDGFEAAMHMLMEEDYTVPGRVDHHDDYLLGFEVGWEEALWWDCGYQDGLDGRSRRCVPDVFSYRYWSGKKLGTADRHATESHA